MKMNLSKFAIAALLLSSSCAGLFQDNKKTVEPIDYITGAEKLNYKNFFNGAVDGFSITKDQNGKIKSTKKVYIDAEWEENKGIIKHKYIYNDGKKDSRTWLVTLSKDGTFDAVGHDVAVPAHGKQISNAAQSTYTLRVKDSQRSEDIFYEDRMYLVDEDSMIMITNYRKIIPDPSPEASDNFGQIITSLHKIRSYKEDDNN